MRKSRSKDAQTEIEHPKAPLVVAEDSEDLDDEEEVEEKGEKETTSSNRWSSSYITADDGERDHGADDNSIRSTGGSNRRKQ